MTTRTRLLLFAFLDEFGPLYALYVMWFDDHGLGVAALSGMFTLWAIAELTLELPSGMLADRFGRKRMVWVALMLRAAGIGVWLLWPTLPGFGVGVLLWAAHGAFASGAWEAYVYDLLDASGEADDYEHLYARLEQAGHAGTAASMVLASALLWAGVSLAALGWLTVALNLAGAVLFASLPAPPPQPDDEPAGELGEAWQHLRPALWLFLPAAAVEGLFLVDEYLPVVARLRDADDAAIPWLMGALLLGLALGGELVTRQISPTRFALLGLLGTGVGLAGLLGPWWALAGIGATYAVLQATTVRADARLQERVPSHVRATVTSARAFVGGLISMGTLAAIGAVTVGADPTPALLAMTAALGALLVTTPIWLR